MMLSQARPCVYLNQPSGLMSEQLALERSVAATQPLMGHRCWAASGRWIRDAAAAAGVRLRPIAHTRPSVPGWLLNIQDLHIVALKPPVRSLRLP
jgi:hypothetical protein